MTRPASIYISNITELGGVWSKARFAAICDWADSHGLKIFLDGARLGSALASPAAEDLTLEHIAMRTSAFTIGGTKNGLLFGEAMVIADPVLKESFPYLIKERGGLMAKGRLLGVQFARAFEKDADGEALYGSSHATPMNAPSACARASSHSDSNLQAMPPPTSGSSASRLPWPQSSQSLQAARSSRASPTVASSHISSARGRHASTMWMSCSLVPQHSDRAGAKRTSIDESMPSRRSRPERKIDLYAGFAPAGDDLVGRGEILDDGAPREADGIDAGRLGRDNARWGILEGHA